MTGKTVRAAHEHPQADGPAPFTTLVELTFQKK
ncbi:glycosidase, partial [Agrobacterium cavarae]